MLNKRSLPIVIIFVIGGFLVALNSSGFGNPPDRFQQIFKQVTEMLEAVHYSPKIINDELTSEKASVIVGNEWYNKHVKINENGEMDPPNRFVRRTKRPKN